MIFGRPRFNPEDLDIANHNQNMSFMSSQMNQLESQNAQNEYLLEEREKGMIREQLDLSEELEIIENLLRGNIMQRQSDGQIKWIPPQDSEMIILSENGIHLIMNAIQFYINKNTLLSNYDEETILQKMEDFATDLSDTVFMESEKIFCYPSDEDCIKVLEERINKKTVRREFANKLLGNKVDKEKIRVEIINELEGRIEKEIAYIKEQLTKNKLKRFLILIRCVQDAVHSTYNRALSGGERRTLRQHTRVLENIGSNYVQEPKKTGFLGIK